MPRTKMFTLACVILAVALAVLCVQDCARAAATPPASDTSVATTDAAAPAPKAPATQLLTVGVLPFQSRDEQRSREVTDIMTADLSTNSAIRLVERSRLDQATTELGLSKTGVGDQESAQKVGFLAGANVLVWGRLFLIDKQAMLVARVVGVETGRVFAEQVRGADTQDLLPMVDELARKVGERITKERAVLLAPDVRDDLQANLNALAETLKGKKLPRVAATVSEEHLGGKAFDPAAETELIYWLTRAGAPVTDLSSQRLQMRQWAKDYYLTTNSEVPSLIPEEVGVLLVGDAVSEPAGQYGPLFTCRYRVEVRAVDRVSGEIVAIARRTGTYVDASPVLAGKSGIQRAAAGIAYEIIPKLAGYVPKARPAEVAPAPAGPPAPADAK
jgi:TolB-like protein